MLRDGCADLSVMARGLKRGIHLGHAFLQPQGPDAVVAPKQKMRVFMENNVEIQVVARLRHGKHDHVLTEATLEKRRDRGGLAVVNRQEWFQSLAVRKYHHDDGRGS